MAKDNSDVDKELGIEEEKGSNKTLLIIIIALVVVLLVGGGVAAWLLLAPSDDESAAGDGPTAEEVAAQEQEEQKELLPPLYHTLYPPFVVNLPPGGKAKLLQVGMDFMMRNPEVLDFVKHNDPMIRHRILGLLGTQNETELRTGEGKRRLQEAILAELIKINNELKGPGEVEAVYFTGFVMQ